MINQPGIASVTIGGVTQYGGNIEFNVPGAEIDPETGSITMPTGSAIVPQEFTLTNTNITNKYIILSTAPTSPGTTKVEVPGLGPMFYGPDFIVTVDDGGKRLSWNGLVLELLLESGNKLIVYAS